MNQGYLIFHLNMSFSSIRAEARPEVVQKCYWPLFKLAETTGIPIGIELSGWTLRQIALLDQPWVDRLRQMIESRQCELIGSGWAQIIGPLVPYEVNRWNQKLGLEAYQTVLGVTPRLAMVNEMAFSTGLVDLYAEVGYQGIIMDRDNVLLALGLEHAPVSAAPTHAQGSASQSLPVLWSDSILFQRLQRVVQGDIPTSEYMAYVKKRMTQDGGVLPIYCNDAEIFDYRPGRFAEESRLHPEGEWERLRRICLLLQKNLAFEWLSPSEALARHAASSQANIRRLTSVSQPIPVKKQAKYNINRWAVAGRDNLWLNTACHRLHQAFARDGNIAGEDWRALCELWASDLRTHITDGRWAEAVERIALLSRQAGLEPPRPEQGVAAGPCPPLGSEPLLRSIQITQDEEGILWTIKTPTVHLVLNARRGLAIASLAFKSHEYEPAIGTLPQGYFSTIELGADFYSGGVLIEIPGQRCRVTDLEWITPVVQQRGDLLSISVKLPLPYGILEKTITVDVESECVGLAYGFHMIERPLGVVRAGILTLLPGHFGPPLAIHCVNGGALAEVFPLDREVNHGLAASALVSSTAAFGATDGCIEVEGAAGRRLVLRWDPAACAVSPLLKHQSAHGRHLTRISFSLCELDDTSRPEGRLLSFAMEMSTR